MISSSLLHKHTAWCVPFWAAPFVRIWVSASGRSGLSSASQCPWERVQLGLEYAALFFCLCQFLLHSISLGPSQMIYEQTQDQFSLNKHIENAAPSNRTLEPNHKSTHSIRHSTSRRSHFPCADQIHLQEICSQFHFLVAKLKTVAHNFILAKFAAGRCSFVRAFRFLPSHGTPQQSFLLHLRRKLNFPGIAKLQCLFKAMHCCRFLYFSHFPAILMIKARWRRTSSEQKEEPLNEVTSHTQWENCTWFYQHFQ